MRSVELDDLTRRARIRDAALAEFAQRGFAGATVRGIAAAAGVSSALVVHHFGSKAQLRDACDAHVVAAVLEAKDALGAADPSATIQRWMLDESTHGVHLGYLARMLVDEGDAAVALLDRLVTQTQRMIEQGVVAGRIRPTSDARVLAILVTMQGVAPLLLRGPLSRILPDASSPTDFARRTAIPLLELYTSGLYTDSALLDAARAASVDEATAR